MEVGDTVYITRNNRLFKLEVTEELPLEDEYRFHNTNLLPEAVKSFTEDFMAGVSDHASEKANTMLAQGVITVEEAKLVILSIYKSLGGVGSPSSVAVNAELRQQGYEILHLVEKSKLFKLVKPFVVGKASARVLSRI